MLVPNTVFLTWPLHEAFILLVNLTDRAQSIIAGWSWPQKGLNVHQCCLAYPVILAEALQYAGAHAFHACKTHGEVQLAFCQQLSKRVDKVHSYGKHSQQCSKKSSLYDLVGVRTRMKYKMLTYAFSIQEVDWKFVQDGAFPLFKCHFEELDYIWHIYWGWALDSRVDGLKEGGGCEALNAGMHIREPEDKFTSSSLRASGVDCCARVSTSYWSAPLFACALSFFSRAYLIFRLAVNRHMNTLCQKSKQMF